MKIRKKSKGFTLVELMACVVILGILTTALVFFFDGTLKVYANENANTTIQFDARRALTSITEDVRNASASSVQIDHNDNYILYFQNNKDGNNEMEYSCNASTNTLVRSNLTKSSSENLVSNIKSVRFEPSIKNPDILVIYIEAQMKNNSSVEYDVSSSVKLPQNVAIKNQTDNMDLSLLERNVINVINPAFNFNLPNVRINNWDEAGNLFFQCNSFDCSGLSGSNIHGDLVIKANYMNFCNNNLSTSGPEDIFDVAKFDGTANTLNSTTYGNDNYSKPDNLQKPDDWKNNSSYLQSGKWNDALDPNNKSSILSLSIDTLKNNADFSNPSIESYIHYYSGTNNKIDATYPDNTNLPHTYSYNDYKGTPNISKVNVTSTNYNGHNNIADGNYEYIICHGPLTISSSKDNQNFYFRGFIYCDDVITFDNITPAFRGILISKGIKVNTTQTQNWNDVVFDKNYGDPKGLSEINKLLEDNTEKGN